MLHRSVGGVVKKYEMSILKIKPSLLCLSEFSFSILSMFPRCLLINPKICLCVTKTIASMAKRKRLLPQETDCYEE